MNDRMLCWKISEIIKLSLENTMRSGRAHEIVGEGQLGGTTHYLDKVAENAVIDYITKHELPVEFVSEEIGRLNFGNEYTIYLDPIDGSNNALSGLPFYCTSIALFRKEKQYGLVRNLVWDEWFEGISYYGSLLNGKPLKQQLHSQMISVYTKKGRYIDELRQSYNKMRCLGSVALELCYVAKGSLLALVDIRDKVRTTDIAAGKVVLENVGGVITDLNGEILDMDAEHMNIVAGCNPKIHKKIINILKE
ncbi:MAG: inositol monophosphatase family protein [Candidatus Methanofastidiosia archaeon]